MGLRFRHKARRFLRTTRAGEARKERKGRTSRGKLSQVWVDEKRSPKSVVGGLGTGNRRKGGRRELVDHRRSI